MTAVVVTSDIRIEILKHVKKGDYFYFNEFYNRLLLVKEIKESYSSMDDFYKILTIKLNEHMPRYHNFYYVHSIGKDSTSTLPIPSDPPIISSLAIVVEDGDSFYLVKKSNDIYDSDILSRERGELGNLDSLIGVRTYIPDNESAWFIPYKDLYLSFTVIDPYENKGPIIFCSKLRITNPPDNFIKNLEDPENRIKIPDWNPNCKVEGKVKSCSWPLETNPN
jgi:hypothetical protein